MACELEMDDISQDDYDAPDPMSIDAQDRYTEHAMREHMLSYERRKSYERAGSAGGVSIDASPSGVADQRRAQNIVLAEIAAESEITPKTARGLATLSVPPRAPTKPKSPLAASQKLPEVDDAGMIKPSRWELGSA